MQLLRLDETDFTSTLKASLDGYVSKQTSDNFGRAYTPHSTKQAFKSFKGKSQCFDLVKRITESTLLLLEIKVTDNLLKFLSYSLRQHSINKILKDTGIPIEYCYNLKDDYNEVNDDIYTLQFSNTAPPENICNDKGRLINKENHVQLKILVDSMLNTSSTTNDDSNNSAGSPNGPDDCVDSPGGSSGSPDKRSNIGALFTKGFADRLQEINLKMLFFAYNVDNQEVFILDNTDLLEVYEEYSKYVVEEVSIDMKEAPLNEIKEYFTQAQEKLETVLVQYDLKREQEVQEQEELQRQRERRWQQEEVLRQQQQQQQQQQSIKLSQ